ncbi:MAG: helix-turn-helix domain-containing protein [Alistipes sp.]|nr:helix-turn-helix domain-containing protein [Alistipes sp.]
MEGLITKESEEFRELVGQLKTAHQSVVKVREKHRPTLADERYLTGEEVMLFLHISPRTLQTLRDNRLIGFTTIGGKILYPETELQKVLLDNYQPTELPF